MNAQALLEQVHTAGGHIEVNGDALKLVAPKRLPDDLVASLRAHKPELLALLKDATRQESETLARAIEIRHQREHGKIPNHYTAVTVCKHCGQIPIFPGVPAKVKDCPWCLNRLAGRPVPKLHD